MNIEFLAHRGLWNHKDEKNSMVALYRALDDGFGLETDIRDFEGELVISHDIPTGSPMHLDRLLHYYRSSGYVSTIALNIKADGLQKKLRQMIEEFSLSQYFVFDMSIPDTLGYMGAGLRTFVRRSELENHPELTRQSQGIWLDELTAPWVDARVIVEESKDVDALCIVSCELHGREYQKQWQEIRKAKISNSVCRNILLCTDLPNEARNYFK